jgi:hypothetical protein
MRPIITPDPKWVYEHFKDYFAAASGSTASASSSTSWAETDMNAHMSAASENAALFIEAFYDACESLPELYPNPGVARINKVLTQTESGWSIQLPRLIRLGEAEAVQVEELPQHLDTAAQDVIQASLSKPQRLLAENSNRLAVQEIIWLLETVSTVFEGVEVGEGTVEGKYFNTIIKDLRRLEKRPNPGTNTRLDQDASRLPLISVGRRNQARCKLIGCHCGDRTKRGSSVL